MVETTHWTPCWFLRTLRSTYWPIIPHFARTMSAPFSEDVNVGCIRKHLSRIEMHYRVNFSSVTMTKCFLSHLGSKGRSGCHQK